MSAVVEQERVLGPKDLEILQIGKEFEGLVKSGAWKLLLDWFAGKVDEALTAHKLNLSTDPGVQQGFKLRWTTTDRLMGDFEHYVYDSVTQKREMVQRLLDSGVTLQQLQDALEPLKANIVG